MHYAKKHNKWKKITTMWGKEKLLAIFFCVGSSETFLFFYPVLFMLRNLHHILDMLMYKYII